MSRLGPVTTLNPGTPVEVRTSYERTWATGFEVVDTCTEGYHLRRLSDGRSLPATFAVADVRRDARGANSWGT